MFWQILFWALLVPCLIVLGIIYGTSKKMYKLFYILSTYTYVITIAYIIDVFHLGRNWILGLLTFSAILMILLGYRLTRNETKAKKQKSTRKNMTALLALLGVMLIIIIVAALGLGATRTVGVEKTLSRDSLIVSDGKGLPPLYPQVATLTYANNFLIPAVISDRYVVACWYKSASDEVAPEELQVLVDSQYPNTGDADPFDEIMMGETVTKRISVGQSYYPVIPVGGEEKPIVDQSRNETLLRFAAYDSIIVAGSSDPFGCYDVLGKRAELTFFEKITLE